MPFPTSKCGRPGEGRFVPGDVVPVDEGTRICGERSTTPSRRKAGSCPGAWCPSTKEQGLAGREAPRRTGGRMVRAWGRGARRRKNKGLRGEKHHAGLVEGRFVPGGVVPVDEGTRVCGEKSTTPSRRNSRLSLRAWCPSTKGQGFAGREAPRRIGGRPVRAWGRGARRRKNKGLRGEKHHAEPPELAFEPGGVVLVDERTRVCGERSTTPNWRKAGSCLGAWCPSTKEQGFAGREAPRRIGGKPVRTRGRGARRRRNKGLRGVKHHAGTEEGRFEPRGVVPVDEGTRVCGE